MANTGPPPDYYRILEISETATTQQIRDAYKKAALKTHPDRVAADSPERPSRTRKFQLVNDAYYTLSDSTRRRDYDAQRRLFGGTRTKPKPSGAANANPPGTFTSDYKEFDFDEEIPPGGANANNFYSWAWNYFTGNKGDANTEQARQATEDAQFADVFEEMLREEGMDEAQQQQGKGKFWSLAGGAAGGVLGFIAANFPGAIAGMVAGNRFGAIRDAKGKSVYEVFQELPQTDRARLLAQLATRVFSHAVGG
ncbi:DnaJ-domain-containing protein [Xylaria bambusicola]|uniref:DnaJ-domain-containing protein n=1 Tax=Xylaria bambusicola TaxID=326684 RepID=UPI002008CB88|nr:DnaJ-domain-containing protein [Xylaria bambusicola]KAI0505282.1 DnaJ-domain-containing protein [Xylaria bambusicola]